jgi:hypothetical protein
MTRIAGAFALYTLEKIRWSFEGKKLDVREFEFNNLKRILMGKFLERLDFKTIGAGFAKVNAHRI